MKNRMALHGSAGSDTGGLVVVAASTRRTPRSVNQEIPPCQSANSNRTNIRTEDRKTEDRFIQPRLAALYASVRPRIARPSVTGSENAIALPAGMPSASRLIFTCGSFCAMTCRR